MSVACVQAVVPLASEEVIDASVIKEEVLSRAPVLEIAPSAAEDRVPTAEASQDVIAASSSDFIVT